MAELKRPRTRRRRINHDGISYRLELDIDSGNGQQYRGDGARQP